MSSQSIVLATLEEQPNQAGLTKAQRLLARAQADDMNRMDERMDKMEKRVDSIDRKVDLVSDKVGSISDKMDLVLAKFKSAECAETKFNFIKDIWYSKQLWWVLIFIAVLIIGEKTKYVAGLFGG